MGFVRTDIETARNEEEKKELEELFERYLQCDSWIIKTIPYKRILELKAPESKKYKKVRPPHDVGVLLTSHPGNRAYLKASVESHKKLGFWITVSYDNYLDPERPEITPNDIMPARDVMDMIDCLVMPHHQSWGGVLFPYMVLLWFGVAAMRNFKYLYCANGDCIIERASGFPKLMELLGDADIMGVGWEDDGGVPKFNTTGMIAKTESLHAIMEHVMSHFVPFETFEKYTQEFGNAEARFAKAITDLGLKQVIVDPPYNTQLHKPGHGTWYKLVKFRHLHAEHNFAYSYKGIPPKDKYLDERFLGDEFRKIKAYWDSGDKKHLEEWWRK
jgi:hypothetical protein